MVAAMTNEESSSSGAERDHPVTEGKGVRAHVALGERDGRQVAVNSMIRARQGFVLYTFILGVPAIPLLP